MSGGPYEIPRNYKGEGKILYIFSAKALVYSFFGAIIGAIFFYIFKMIGLTMMGFFFMVAFAVLGFSIATFKIPDIKKFEITAKTGGENIDTIIVRWVKFKNKHNKVYVYKEKTKEGENKNG